MEHRQARLRPRSTDHPFQFDLTHQLASRLRHWEGPPTGSATDAGLPAAPARRTEPMATAHPSTDDALGELRRALPQIEVLSAVDELKPTGGTVRWTRTRARRWRCCTRAAPTTCRRSCATRASTASRWSPAGLAPACPGEPPPSMAAWWSRWHA